MVKANLVKENLTGDHIGVFFGTLAPMHIGHQAEIYKAAALNDGVVVITSGYTGDRGDQIGLPVEKRFRYLREAFNDESAIKVDYINEDDIPQMPNGWQEWTARLTSTIRRNITNPNAHITLYTGEADYKEMLEKLLPDDGHWSVSLMDRTILKVSATAVRKDPLGNWDYINRVFRRHFAKKILVVGAPKTGKSTLTRRLARTSNSPFSVEFSRTYQEKSNVFDSELLLKDYSRIIQGQYDANSAEINSPANNGLTFFDTDAMVTMAETRLWLDQEEANKLKALFDTTIAEEELDLILVIPPMVAVQNGADKRRSLAFDQNLWQVLKEYGFLDKTVLLDRKGDKDDPFGYYARYLQALEIIEKRVGVNLTKV
ncbi:AAA family ATPase [Fructobacillus sp. M1-13]|uniref:AAA family ATPase n=1 Tax=Fructobacillus papyriferae TaxID=2713171 RepID=A0ABS5QR87_9LACO|nr:AAA family ATPase [Fructobacillus papyriferae]MBS9334482.1 AAA family ATPase [Fructobacillus papyriferae]MCD2158471.1 AAA family ATPase [Fructobacillus papyriferae]